MSTPIPIAIYTKDPSAVLDYTEDWSDWLQEDRIDTPTVTVPEGLTLNAANYTGSQVTLWLASGADGVDYMVNVHVLTTGGRQDTRSFLVRVLER